MRSVGGKSETYQEATTHEKRQVWLKAMHEEMKFLHENHTYDLVKLLKGKKALKNQWVYMLKTRNHSSQTRFKARLVVKGFSQKKEVYF